MISRGDTEPAGNVKLPSQSLQTQSRSLVTTSDLYNASIPSSEWFGDGERIQNHLNLVRPNSLPVFSISRGIPLDQVAFNEMIPIILTQYMRIQHRIFQPFPMEHGLIERASQSDITRWTMYIMAKAAQAILDGNLWEHHMGWVVRFHREVIGSPTSPESTTEDLCARLSGLSDLCACTYMLSNTRRGYALFKTCTPLALQLAAKFPNLWSPDSAIVIAHAVHASVFEINWFVFSDTMTALALGIPPLLHYDTTYYPERPRNDFSLELANGCPAHITILLARINAWRASRWMEGSDLDTNQWREAEELLQSWSPPVESEGESHDLVGRFAVRESWRHAVFIYLYMGMCDVNSADQRVQTSVKQVVQLATTIEPGNRHEYHLFIPCLIAGAAARQEKHRAIIRKKIATSRRERFWVLPGADFVPVLDHLWHGVGVNGSPTTWDNYVNSRCAMLPLDM